MKKVLKPIMIVALALPTFAFADTTTAAKVQQARGATTALAAQANGNITVQSPRTGIRYTFANPNQRPVVLQTAAIAPVNAATVNRIVASNPALSPEVKKMLNKRFCLAQHSLLQINQMLLNKTNLRIGFFMSKMSVH